jgi:hypothetical protein
MFCTRRFSFLLALSLLFSASSVQAGDGGTWITVKDLTVPGIAIAASADVDPAPYRNTTRFWFTANGGAFLNVGNTVAFKVSPGTHTIYALDASSAAAFANTLADNRPIASLTVTVKKGKTLKLKVTGPGTNLVISAL